VKNYLTTFKRKLKILDKTLIEGLKTVGIERQRFENYLYDNHSYLVKVGMQKYNLPESEALTAYTNTILAVIKNIETEQFKGTSTIKTYLTGIFYRRCVDLGRKKTTNKENLLPIDDFFNISDTVKGVLEQLILKERVEELTFKIQQLGEKCQNILGKWAGGYSDKEIASIGALELNSAATVKTTRHRCLRKLKAL